MSLRLIESFDSSDATLAVEGSTLPSQCLLEDEDGIRWFLTADPALVPAHPWIRAASSGASALLSPTGAGYAAITTETFMDHRVESGTGYTTPQGFTWPVWDHLPSYADLLRPQAPAGPQRPTSDFVHLHNHSEFSLLDGLSKVSEIIEVVQAQGGHAVGVADHGNCAVHPELQKQAAAAGIKPIFAMEAYLVDDRLVRPDDFDNQWALDHPAKEWPGDTVARVKVQYEKDLEAERDEKRKAFVAEVRDYYHLVLIAVDDTGLHNLWAMSSESNQDGFYYKPRLDWSTLERYSEGVIATTACLRGPLVHHGLRDGDEQAARMRLGRLLDIFGDRLYVEIHTNHLDEQIQANKDLVRLAREHQVPLVAAVDAHYPAKEDREAHRVWLSMQTESDIADESSLFAGGQDYHMKTPAEVAEALAYLGEDVVAEAMGNTVVIADQCTAQVGGKVIMPVFSKKGGAEADADRLLDLCLANWDKTVGKIHSQEEYMARFEREFDLLRRKGFCGYFLMTAEMTTWAKDHKILVGPGRGSGGGSLVAYLARITDIDPVEADLLFERFMTDGRTAMPDFDIDYPATKKRTMQDHARDYYGEDSVVVVGSIIRLKNKGVIKKLAKTLKSRLPDEFYLDHKAITAIIDDAEGDTAGLGLSWEALWDKAGEDLEPYREAYPYLFEMADKLVGRVASFGQHAAGLIITTDGALTNRLPMRRSEEVGHMIAQFDKDVLEELGYTKFDLLTIRNLDTIQETVALIEQRRSHLVDVYSWAEEYNDPQVWEEVAEAHTLGIFQIETTLGTRYAKRMAPRSLADLADLVTIVRPGPRNSGLTETYLRRRDGLEEVTFPDPRLERVLAKTYGCMLYQEDIMQACMVLGGYDSNEADGVRKILGKKKVEKTAAAGQEFITRSTANGMDRDAAAALWAQMAEFAKYSFNRAHAYAYAMLGYWCAWLKFHYPVEFLTSVLSGVDKDRIPDFIKEARRMGFSVLPPDINLSGHGFRALDLSVRYGLDSIKGIGTAASIIQEGQPFTSFEDFMTRMVDPKGSKVNRGHVATLARIGAFDSLEPNRRGLEQMLLAEKTGEARRCVFKTDGGPGETFTWISIEKDKTERQIVLPCSFDWDGEPVPVNPRTGKKAKRKNPPKKCTTACRNYTAPPPTVIADVEAYTDADIRDIEQELLGVFLSSTPFDMLDPEDREVTLSQAEMLVGDRAPEGLYLIAGVLTKARPYRDSTGRDMGFLAFDTEVSTLDVVCFNSAWERFRRDLKVGQFYAAEIERNSRGYNLSALMPYSQGAR